MACFAKVIRLLEGRGLYRMAFKGLLEMECRKCGIMEEVKQVA